MKLESPLDYKDVHFWRRVCPSFWSGSRILVFSWEFSSTFLNNEHTIHLSYSQPSLTTIHKGKITIFLISGTSHRSWKTPSSNYSIKTYSLILIFRTLTTRRGSALQHWPKRSTTRSKSFGDWISAHRRFIRFGMSIFSEQTNLRIQRIRTTAVDVLWRRSSQIEVLLETRFTSGIFAWRVGVNF